MDVSVKPLECCVCSAASVTITETTNNGSYAPKVSVAWCSVAHWLQSRSGNATWKK